MRTDAAEGDDAERGDAAGKKPPEPPGPVPRPGWRRMLMDTRPLRRPPYRWLWVSSVVTAVGSQLTAVAVPKQIYDITGSSAWIGYASLAGLVPLIVFGLWGGAVADMVDRRTLMLVTNCGIALTSLLFWAQAAAGAESVGLLMVLLALQQAFFAMNSPARNASVARLVPAEELPAAQALGSTATYGGLISGPMLAGALIPVLGLPALYLMDTVALAVAVVLVRWGLPALPAAAGAPRRAGLREVAAGFRYAAASAVLLMSFVVDIAAMVFGMPRALFPQLADTTYAGYGESFALGALFAAIPVGAMLGGLLSGAYTRARRHGLMVLGAVVVWGLAVVGFGLSESLWWAVAFLALAGFADMVSAAFRGAILQSVATDEMRGRMQGVFLVVVAGGPRLADLLHGVAADTAGLREAVVGGGLLVVAATLVLAVAFPSFARYRAR